MEFKFDLSESKIEGIKYYGKLIFGDDEDESITVDITVRENEGELYVCYPSKYSNKDDCLIVNTASEIKKKVYYTDLDELKSLLLNILKTATHRSILLRFTPCSFSSESSMRFWQEASGFGYSQISEKTSRL